MLKANEKCAKSNSKVQRYGWEKRGEKGELAWVNKNTLSIDSSYQRNAKSAKVLKIAADWSWVGCGVIVVSRRNGLLYVVDGQHRVLAALKRDDITHLPALIFDITEVNKEAEGFIDLNVNRKPLDFVYKYKALIVAGDKVALAVDDMLQKHGISIVNGRAKKSTNSGARLMRSMASNPEKTRRVFDVACEICQDEYISEMMLGGLWVLDSKIKGGLSDDKLRKRLISVGREALEMSAKRAAAFYARGGDAVWADGMLQEINKNLRNKFEVEA